MARVLWILPKFTVLLFLSETVLTHPLKLARRFPQSFAKRDTFFVSSVYLFWILAKNATQTADCPGQLPQDPINYPTNIRMQPWEVDNTGTITAIEYIDQWGQKQYIDDNEALCDRAGCYCNGPTINCHNTGGLFYEPAIAAQYAEICFHTCECLAMPELPDIINNTRIDLGGGNFVNLPGDIRNSVNRLNPSGAVLGSGACLAGEAAGWTFRQIAEKTCCSGYSFNSLSAQEAYMIYGFPYVSDIIAGTITIGVCLKAGSQ